jgi:drug/metabolite transporter (DMT)-like permease
MKGFLLLLGATSIWGLGFAATRWTLVDYSATWSNGIRLGIAGIISLFLLLARRKPLWNKGGFYCAVVLILGLQFQTVGIGITSLAKSGFLTTLYALFIPLIMAVFFKYKFRRTYWLILALSLFGVALMCELKLDGFNVGDAYTLLGSVFFALHILAVDRWASKCSSLDFNFYQCLYCGVLGVLGGIIFDTVPDLSPLLEFEKFGGPSTISGFAFLAIVSSIMAYTMQVESQKTLPAHVAGLLFLMESIFSAFFGFIFFGETLSTQGMLGCALILLCVASVPYFTRYEKS